MLGGQLEYRKQPARAFPKSGHPHRLRTPSASNPEPEASGFLRATKAVRKRKAAESDGQRPREPLDVYKRQALYEDEVVVTGRWGADACVVPCAA